MIEVRLHGALAKQYGMVWDLDVTCPRQAVAIIDANRPGFRRKILELANKGYVYRVKTSRHEYDSNDIDLPLTNVKRLDIIPVILGAGAGLRFVLGAVLVVVGALTSAYGGAALVGIGASLMLGAVTEWLTPKAKHDDGADKLSSWSINGASNNVDQGTPVPIIYGEVLTGSYPISSGISATQIYGGSADPVVTIGGDTQINDNTGTAGTFTSVIILGAGPFNMSEPFGFTWTTSGFTSAQAVRVSGNNTAALRIEIDFPTLNIDSYYEVTGTASLTITGKRVNHSDEDVSASASVPIKSSINTRSFGSADAGGG